MPRAILILGMALAAADHARGSSCDGKTVLFEDKFVNLANWTNVSKEFAAVKDGVLTLSVANGQSVGSLYRGDVFEDVDICATVRLTESNVPKDSSNFAVFSLRFWAKDGDNRYELDIAPVNGTFHIDRLVGSRYLGGDWSKSPAVKGAGENNVIRVSVRGSQAKYYINDSEVQSESPKAGHPPDGGSMVGWAAGSVEDAKCVWSVSSFKVTK